MGEIGAPPPVRRIVSAIFSDRASLSGAVEALAQEHGGVRQLGQEMSFDFTDYYESEMGGNLRRGFFEVEGLVSSEELVALKRFTSDVERRVAAPDGRRRVNLDPGILSAERLVLASTKNAPHRLYLGRGIYAELTLVYQSGGFQALPWTYPDYASEAVRGLLCDVRKRYLAELKEGRA